MTTGPGGQYILPHIVDRYGKPITASSPWTPNRSSRNGASVSGIVVHDTEGGYLGAVQTLCNPAEQASAHMVLREDGNLVTQLVPYSQKAWHAEAANLHTRGLELAGRLDHELDGQWRSAARIVAKWCVDTRVPPRWSMAHGGVQAPGITRHKDWGYLGGGHIDPITRLYGDHPPASWIWFISLVQHEYERGEFLPHWGVD